VRARGEDVFNVKRCGEKQRATTVIVNWSLEDGEVSHTLGETCQNGGRGYLRRGNWIGDERFVSGRGECTCEAIGAKSMLRLIHRDMTRNSWRECYDLTFENP